MIVKLLTEHHLYVLSLKGGCTGSSEFTLVKIPICWKSHAMAKMSIVFVSISCSPRLPYGGGERFYRQTGLGDLVTSPRPFRDLPQRGRAALQGLRRTPKIFKKIVSIVPGPSVCIGMAPASTVYPPKK